MFYTIYDAIVFKAEKNGIKEEEVRKKLRKRGFTSERLGLLKNNCTTLLTEEILTIIFDEFGLRKLEIDLMLGKVPKEYEESYLSNVSAIADLLKKEEFQKRKAEEKRILPPQQNSHNDKKPRINWARSQPKDVARIQYRI